MVYGVLWGLTGFDLFLFGFTEFHWILLDFTGFYLLLLGFIELYRVLLFFFSESTRNVRVHKNKPNIVNFDEINWEKRLFDFRALLANGMRQSSTVLISRRVALQLASLRSAMKRRTACLRFLFDLIQNVSTLHSFRRRTCMMGLRVHISAMMQPAPHMSTGGP